jgi:hypothetical protein
VRRERRTLTASWEKKKKKNKSVIVIYDSWERERRYMCPRLNGRDGPLDSLSLSSLDTGKGRGKQNFSSPQPFVAHRDLLTRKHTHTRQKK